ncbi:MAG: hypothetical protein NT009_13105 [Proteobacteria bacterium]|nr:hypothetical protein [Pseudomonadota bacterium]
MKKIYISTLVITALLFLLPIPSQAIPAFARNHGFNCNMCHTAFPKLNDFGQRVRDNGYQIPGQQGHEKNVLETPIPLSLRTTPGVSLYHGESGNTLGFGVYGLDLLGAGVLHKDISFLLIYTPRIDEPAGDFTGSNNGSNPGQLGSLESANIVFSNLVKDAVNLRIGRFEPAYQVFSSKRNFYIFQPYEIIGYASPASGAAFGDNQVGLELSGHFRNGFKYALGVVNGTGGIADNNLFKDFYLNLVQVFGKGDGQSAGQRVGLFGYLGEQPTRTGGATSPYTGSNNGQDNNLLFRFGGDLSLNWKTFNLIFLYLVGIDDQAFNLVSPDESYIYSGGFVELDYAGLLNNRLIGSLLYNFVLPPSSASETKVHSVSALGRYYLGDWTAVNVALHGEYTFKLTGDDNTIKEHLFSFLVDFDL